MTPPVGVHFKMTFPARHGQLHLHLQKLGRHGRFSSLFGEVCLFRRRLTGPGRRFSSASNQWSRRTSSAYISFPRVLQAGELTYSHASVLLQFHPSGPIPGVVGLPKALSYHGWSPSCSSAYPEPACYCIVTARSLSEIASRR